MELARYLIGKVVARETDAGRLSERIVETEAYPTINPGMQSAQTRLAHQPEGTIGVGPQVLFTRSGLTVSWRPD